MARTEELSGMEGPGVARVKNVKLDRLIGAWREILEDRMALTEKEITAKQKVLEAMHEAGLTCYQYDDEKKVVLTPGKENVKVKSIAEEADAEEE